MRITLFLLSISSCLQLNAQLFSESALSIGIDHVHLDSTLMGGGLAIFDYNNDGYEDIYLTGGDATDQLYRNDQNGSFTEVGTGAGLGITTTIKTSGVATGDIDNDGDRDIFVTTGEDFRNILFENNGDGTFTDISISAGIIDHCLEYIGHLR